MRPLFPTHQRHGHAAASAMASAGVGVQVPAVAWGLRVQVSVGAGCDAVHSLHWCYIRCWQQTNRRLERAGMTWHHAFMEVLI